MQSCVARHGATNGATAAIEVGPAKVELLGVAKSTWNCHRFNVPATGSMSITKFGEPAGGSAAPSTSEGRRLEYAAFRLKHTKGGACTPASMAVLSHAHTSGPTNVSEPVKMFHVT